jgi:hypothetical protein
MNCLIPTRTTGLLLSSCHRLALFVALLLNCYPVAQASVWPVRAQWDAAAERAYSQWVETHFNENIFYLDSPYADMPTDCADAAYGMRMVYAYENGLPFAIRDPQRSGASTGLKGGAGLITEQSSLFNHRPAGLPRFLAFMNWVMSITNTATLVHDTYPVKVDREQIRPGIIYLTWHTHAMQVVGVRSTGVIRYLATTTPRAVRPMRATVGYPLYVPADPKARRFGDGFRRFKQPADYSKAEASLAGYGTEQFEQANVLRRELLPYYEWVRRRLALVDEPPWHQVRRGLIAICELAWDRGNAIDEAQLQLQTLRRQGRRCMNRTEYEEHSTPGRDRQLTSAFEHLEKLSSEPWSYDNGTQFHEFADFIFGRLPELRADEISADFLQWCDVGSVDGGPGRSMNLAHLWSLVKRRQLQADPHGRPAQRWGLEPFTGSCRAAR